jgi:hypothetical protein
MPGPFEFPFQSIGPCQVKFGGVDLGYTEEDVMFEDTLETVDIKYSQTGTNPQKMIATGRKVVATVPLAQATIARLNGLVPGGVVSSNKILVSNPVGLDLTTLAGILELTRIVSGVPSTQKEEVLRIFKAVPAVDFKLAFGSSKTKVVNVTFTGICLTTSGHVGEMWEAGNPT